MKQFCAECGRQLAPLPLGQFARCCHGWGYWAPVKPPDNYKLPKHDGYYLYINPLKWPKGIGPAKPHGGDH